MYTGTIIEELIASVSRVEQHVALVPASREGGSVYELPPMYEARSAENSHYATQEMGAR